jgi:hypothetical protein
LAAIVHQGEGAPSDTEQSHYQRFVTIRGELAQLLALNPNFVPAHPAATNPVLRKPPRPEGRVWIESERAAETVDVANACYGLMLRLLAMAYQVPSPTAVKGLLVDLGVGLMRAMTPLAEQAARLPAGPTNPTCNAGVSFITLRSSAVLPLGAAARFFVMERLDEIIEGAQRLHAVDSSLRVAQVLPPRSE